MRQQRLSSYALLATVVVANPNCIDSISAQRGTVSSPDVTASPDASMYVASEIVAMTKVTCASLAETCGHSRTSDVCGSVDKQDFTYELSVEVDKFLQGFEEILQSIETRENLTDLSSKVKHSSYSDGTKYSSIHFNTGKFYGHITIAEYKDGKSIAVFKNPNPDNLPDKFTEAQTTGGDITCKFDAKGKPITMWLWTPLSLNFKAQCVRESARYQLFGNYSDQYSVQNVIIKMRDRGGNDQQTNISDGCSACDPEPIQCDFSQTSVSTECTTHPDIEASEWVEYSTRKIDPKIAQSLLEKLAAKINQMLEKHGIQP